MALEASKPTSRDMPPPSRPHPILPQTFPASAEQVFKYMGLGGHTWSNHHIMYWFIAAIYGAGFRLFPGCVYEGVFTDKNKKQNKTTLDVRRITYLKRRWRLCIDWGPRCSKEKSSRVPVSPFLCFLAPTTGNCCSTMFSCYGSLNVLKPLLETNLFSFMLFLSSVVLIATQN